MSEKTKTKQSQKIMYNMIALKMLKRTYRIVVADSAWALGMPCLGLRASHTLAHTVSRSILGAGSGSFYITPSYICGG